MLKGATFQAPTGCQWQTLETSCYGSKLRKNVDYWKKNTVYIRTLHTGKNPSDTGKKLGICTLHLFAADIFFFVQYLQGLGT